MTAHYPAEAYEAEIREGALALVATATRTGTPTLRKNFLEHL